MKDTTIIYATSGVVAAGILAAVFAKSKATVTAPPASTTSSSIFLGLSNSTVILGESVGITVTLLGGQGGATVQIFGLPASPITLTTNSAAIASTTITMSSAGTYTVYATSSGQRSASHTLTVTAQCSNSAQCPSGQVCSGGKCVTCSPQRCACGKYWSSTDCACATQIPQVLQFTESNGNATNSYDYYNHYEVETTLIPTIVTNIVTGMCMRSTTAKCPSGGITLQACSTTKAYPHGAVGAIYARVYGRLLDNNRNPVCSQSISLSLSNSAQTITDGNGITYISTAAFSNGSQNITVKTDSNGEFTATLAFNVKLDSYPSTLSTGGGATETVGLITTMQLNASYANLNSTVLINYKGIMEYCGGLI